MFADHQAKVFKRYQQLKVEGPLSANLKVPAPARLRDECESVIEKRFSKDDQEILSSFFGEHADLDDYVRAIGDIDIDLFRPLERFMKGSVLNPHTKHVELLAWLIDYNPRPYRATDMYAVPEKPTIELIADPLHEKGDADNAQLFPGVRLTKKISLAKTAGIVLMILIASGLVVYLVLGNYKNVGVQKCMYWTGDHYEAISCDAKPADTTATVIGLDSNKITHFKRITRADTLTAASIGKVWYIKINDDVEYYTSPGEPPAHPGRRLLPLTAHILDVHPRHAK